MTNPQGSVNPRSAATPNPAAMSLPASPPLASPQAAIAATTAAVAVAAVDARVALVLGATGLVGRAILARLLADKSYSQVHCVGRRAPRQVHPRMVVHLTESLTSFQAPPVDDVFIALGTTIKVAGSQQAFRAVDLEAVLAMARSARAAGARRLGVVSAMGADAASPVFYNRIKGEMENAVASLAYDCVVFARPSLLAGDRQALAQPARAGEKIALRAMRLFQSLVPANYRAIQADDVAAALVDTLRAGRPGVQVLLSGAMQPA